MITEMYTYRPGRTCECRDLTNIDAIVTALGRALSTGTDIWVPYPVEDLGREQHIRRLSLVLQRHGLNLRVGPKLQCCPINTGVSDIDTALRKEVHAVDHLGHAALAAASITSLHPEIAANLSNRPAEPTHPADPPDT